MELTKYVDSIKLDKEKLQEALAPKRANEMHKKAELEVAKIEGNLAEKEQAIQEIASVYPIDFDRLLDAIDDLDLTIRRKEQFGKIIKELF